MLQFKLPQLSIKNVPLIERQILRIYEQYRQLRKRIEGGNLEALQQLVQLRSQQKHILQIEGFCRFIQQNQQNECILFLHPLKYLLLQIISSSGKRQIQEQVVQVPWKNKAKCQQSHVTSSRKSVSPLKQSKLSNSSNKNLLKYGSRHVNQQKQKTLDNSKKRCEKVINPQSNILSDINVKTIKQKSMNTINKPTKTSEVMVREPSVKDLEISFNNKQIFLEPQQTLFTFKMTKRQYEEILKFKKKKINTSQMI